MSDILLLIGVLFFITGTIGLIRFPDTFCRLHALAKVDNLGLGFIVFALVIDASSIFIAIKLIFIWVLALIASSSLAYLISNKIINSSKDSE